MHLRGLFTGRSLRIRIPKKQSFSLILGEKLLQGGEEALGRPFFR